MTFITNILSVTALIVFVVVLIACGLLVAYVIKSIRDFNFYSIIPGSRNRGPNISVISLNREMENIAEQINELIENEESGSVPDPIFAKGEQDLNLPKPNPSNESDHNEDTSEEGEDATERRSDLPRMFTIEYVGDIMGTSNDDLIALVTTILGVAREGDEVVISIESGGGTVPAYGLAASQIQRLKDKGIKVTTCIDKIAASGGYLMACTSDHIVCAPFGIVGSIGVVSSFPNYNNLLEKIGVDYKEYTAGEFKRTVSPLTKITPEREQKFVEQLEGTHELFKYHISKNRPSIDIDLVSTGEHWYGQEAIKLGLVDEISTCDEWVLNKMSDYEIYIVTLTRPLTIREKISESISDAGMKIFNRILTQSNNASIQ